MAAIGNALAERHAARRVRDQGGPQGRSGRSSAWSRSTPGRAGPPTCTLRARDDRDRAAARRRLGRGSPGSRRSAPQTERDRPAPDVVLPPPGRRPAERGRGQVTVVVDAGRRRRRLPRPSRPSPSGRLAPHRPPRRRRARRPARAVRRHDRRRRARRPSTRWPACATSTRPSAAVGAPSAGRARPSADGRRSTVAVDAATARSARSSGHGGRSSAPSTSPLLLRGEGPGGRRRRRRPGRAFRIVRDELGVRGGPRPRHPPRLARRVPRDADGAPGTTSSGSMRVSTGCSRPGCGPIVELSFMPRGAGRRPRARGLRLHRDHLAAARPRGAGRTSSRRSFGTSSSGYGRDEVARWPFEVWNEPNLQVFWSGRQSDYFDLYDATARAVKARRRATPRRRAVDRRGRLGRRPARPRRPDRRPGRLRDDPHLRRAAARPAPDPRAVRASGPAAVVDRVGHQPDPRRAGQRQRLGRAARRPRDALGGRPAGRARLLGRLGPVRRARRARAPVPRRVRAADDRRPAQAAVLGHRAARAARRAGAGEPRSTATARGSLVEAWASRDDDGTASRSRSGTGRSTRPRPRATPPWAAA